MKVYCSQCGKWIRNFKKKNINNKLHFCSDKCREEHGPCQIGTDKTPQLKKIEQWAIIRKKLIGIGEDDQ